MPCVSIWADTVSKLYPLILELMVILIYPRLPATAGLGLSIVSNYNYAAQSLHRSSSDILLLSLVQHTGSIEGSSASPRMDSAHNKDGNYPIYNPTHPVVFAVNDSLPSPLCYTPLGRSSLPNLGERRARVPWRPGQEGR